MSSFCCRSYSTRLLSKSTSARSICSATRLPCSASPIWYLRRFLTAPQPRKEPRRAAERPLKRFISDQARAFGMIFQHELARVKCLELGAVPDTDDGGFREPLSD